MNVQELIAELEKIEDKTVEVATEGCDCDGDVDRVEFHEAKPRQMSQKKGVPAYVYLRRSK